MFNNINNITTQNNNYFHQQINLHPIETRAQKQKRLDKQKQQLRKITKITEKEEQIEQELSSSYPLSILHN